MEGPVLLHVMTTKGKGYEPAETAPDKFHGIGPFDIESGKVLAKKDGDTYTDVFGKVLCDEASRNPDIVAITAAMQMEPGLPDLRSIIRIVFLMLELRKNTV